MSKILTIIVPMYNMEQYICRCLSSLLPSSSNNQFEVLVINDGSYDNSLSLARQFELKYPNIYRIIDKENGNYGSCINIGLKEAQGKYIKILDADDRFDSTIFPHYLQHLSNVDVDLVISDFVMRNTLDQVVKHITYDLPNYDIFDFQSVPPKINMWMHAVTYKTENLRAINYKQTEGISYTDQEWIFLPMSTVNRISYFPMPLYSYLVGRDGQTMDPSVYIKNISHEILGLKVMLAEFTTIEKGNQSRKYLINRLMARIDVIYQLYLVRSYKLLDIKDLEDMDNYMKAYPEIYEMANAIKISRYIPYRYINKWRNGKRIPLIVRYLVEIKNFITKILRR